ncbi:putative ATP-dependent RNA helicase DBP7 [Rosellinia necatrix]|uniref:ATP-dependent RNA helicase n=1 Tax=Rosellinia necatrix TaxID=77044 RepID=A0A1W2TTJ9_ROSNE|nr:putative ATP-dependent RNA helicase DBP7 [Rosellinia necatrix]
MSNGGLLLNFDLTDQPLKRQVKFTGGRWRDRVSAQRSAKRNGDGQSTSANATPLATNRRDHDPSLPDDIGHERPAKRQRTQGDPPRGRPDASSRSLSYMTGKLPPGSINAGPKNSGQGNKQPGGVVSRLFSSNPTPKTVFENPVENVEPAMASNAPLSDEAENFHALGLSRRIAHHLSTKLEMKAPTSIQKNAIPPLVREDSDAFLQAQTGSGKTLAYLLPIVQRIMAMSQNEDGTNTGVQIHRDSGLFAIILAPTRELCKQIATVLEKILRCAPWIVSTTVIGGESKKSEKARLRKGVNILVATPGRLADHLDNTKVLDVGTVRWLVLDEGDRLMEMGFEDELKSIVSKIREEGLKGANKDGVKFDKLPQRRVTVLCSATMKRNVQKLGEISLQDAIHIAGTEGGNDEEGTAEIDEAVFAAPSQLRQSYLIVPAKLRLVTLIALLKSSFARRGSIMKAIIFISCADSVDFHFELFRNAGARSASSEETSLTDGTVADAAYITSPANPAVSLLRLHGSLPQPVRTATLNSFRSLNDPCVLITTDIASRGLDVPAVDLVIEYDPAFSVDDHTHRIGRTARAGRPGKAVLFIQPGCEEGYIDLLNSTASSVAPQSYESTLQKGFFTPITLPKPNREQDAPTLVSEKQTPNSRAEALQLHIEQRLLVTEKEGSNSKFLDSARQAFRSHIRAYATHVRDERKYFDITQLHLGHTAKSYGLREAPGGIGGGPTRRMFRGGQGKSGEEKGADRDGKDKASGTRRIADDDIPAVDEAAAARMRMKMKQVMNAASEFNLG